MKKLKGSTPIGGLIIISIWLYCAIAWIVNVVKLVNCDFDAPWKDEAIHIIGLFPGLSAVTCWF